jgi:hypothetical protein
MRHMRRLRRLVVRIVAVLLCTVGAGAAAVAWSPAANAGPLCTATYSVQTQWNTGFVAILTVTNSGATAITGWTVALRYAGNQAFQTGWNGIWSQPGFGVTVNNASYNGNLAPGNTISNIGAIFMFSGINNPPTVACAAQ